MKISRTLSLLVCAAPAFAHDAEIQKQLLQRQQATDAFNLQMRQSQEALRASTGDRQALDTRQFSERHRLRELCNHSPVLKGAA